MSAWGLILIWCTWARPLQKLTPWNILCVKIPCRPTQNIHSDSFVVVYVSTTCTHTHCSVRLSSTGAAEVFYHVVVTKANSKKQVSQLSRVSICFHCWAHFVSLQSDACDFPPDKYHRMNSALSLSGQIYTDVTQCVFGWAQEHIKGKFMYVCVFMDYGFSFVLI